MRKKIIAGNWKMHKTFAEARDFMKSLIPLISPKCTCRILIAPPFPLLSPMVDWAKGSLVEIGVQNIHDQEEGAFTGEVSAKLVREMGACFSLIGHSERRQQFQEKGDFLRRKVQRALLNGLQPILCIGETLEEREKGQRDRVLQKQLFEALEGFSAQQISQIVIAYEPVWAIGTGKHATPSMADEAHAFCRFQLTEKWGREVALKIPILYGGSVNPGNVKALMQQEDIDGVLVGGASLAVETFSQIIQYNQ